MRTLLCAVLLISTALQSYAQFPPPFIRNPLDTNGPVEMTNVVLAIVGGSGGGGGSTGGVQVLAGPKLKGITNGLHTLVTVSAPDMATTNDVINATNGLGSAAFVSTSTFDAAGKALTATNQLAIANTNQFVLKNGDTITGDLILPNATPGSGLKAASQGYVISAIFGKVDSTRLVSTTSPLSGGGDLSADRTLSISDAAADGSTKGAAAFTSSDFNAASGVISLDYANGQKASGSQPGFLSSADWATFNGKGSGNGTVTSVATGSGLTGGTITGSGTISGVDAAADGTTKGVAAFTAADFNASSGLISIDYANGQKATTSQPGFLTAADWTTFNGKVSSVGLSLPSELTVSGSPVTSSGTLSATWATESANRVLAGPTSGGAATPTFRALVLADIPDLSSVYDLNYWLTNAVAAGSISNKYTGQVWFNGGGLKILSDGSIVETYTITAASANFTTGVGSPSVTVSTLLGAVEARVGTLTVTNGFTNLVSAGGLVQVTRATKKDLIDATAAANRPINNAGSDATDGSQLASLQSPNLTGLVPFASIGAPILTNGESVSTTFSNTVFIKDSANATASVTNGVFAGIVTASSLTNEAATISTAAIYDAKKKVTSLANGGNNTVLHGTTPPTETAVVEADLSLTDVTTANVSTSAHGFAPKAPNDGTKYLDGLGNYSVPAGASTGIVTNQGTGINNTFSNATMVGGSIFTNKATTDVPIEIDMNSNSTNAFQIRSNGTFVAANTNGAWLASDGAVGFPGFAFWNGRKNGVYNDTGNGIVGLSFNGTEVSGYGANALYILNGINMQFSGGAPGSVDTIFGRIAAATFQMGVDAASPSAQTLKGANGSGADKPGGNFTNAPGWTTGSNNVPGYVYVAFPGSTNKTASTKNVSPVGGAIGGSVFADTASSNNLTTAETIIRSNIVQAGLLSQLGFDLHIVAGGTYAANATTKTIQLYVGTTSVFSSGAIAANNASWKLDANIVMTGTNSVLVSTSFDTSSTALSGSAGNVSVTGSQFTNQWIYITSTSGIGGANSDTVCNFWKGYATP